MKQLFTTKNWSVNQTFRLTLLLIFLQISIFSSVIAQNSIWSLAPNYIDMVFGGAPTPLPIPPQYTANPNNLSQADLDFYYYHGQEATGSHNAMQDSDGNLLFFVVDDMVYDRDGYLINQITDPEVTVDGTTETMIVPDPGNCSQYYIFINGRSGESMINTKFHYTIININEPNIYSENGSNYIETLQFETRNGILIPNGDYTSINIFDLFNLTQDLEWPFVPAGNIYMASSTLRADNSRLLFIFNYNTIYRFVLDENGLNYDGNIVLTIPTSWNQEIFSHDQLYSEMELINIENSNYRIALSFHAFDGIDDFSSHYPIYIADLNNNGLLIPDTEIFLYGDNIGGGSSQCGNRGGLEFSPDGNILYMNKGICNTLYSDIFYYNLELDSEFELNAPSSFNQTLTQIELGIDNKMYFGNGDNILYLDDPNNPQVSNWNIGFPLSYLPTFINNNFGIGIYTLPDQIDGMDYFAINANDENCCLSGAVFDESIYTVISDDTWIGTSNPINPGSDVVYIENELRIPAGTDLTIHNMTFRFAPDAKVVIEASNGTIPRGKLIINNTTFTIDNRCSPNLMWQGVEVLGHANQSQLGTIQGKFIMRSESKIEHAITGVKVGTLLNNTGGIVITRNAHFENNKRDIRIWPHTYTNGGGNVISNSCSFNKTNFIVNNQLNNGDVNLSNRVFMYGVTGVLFRACNFGVIDQGLDYYTNENGGFGILSFLSSYNVKGQCPYYPGATVCDEQDVTAHWIGTSQSEIIPSTFKNLRFGIYSLGMGSGNATSIEQSLFDRNKSGAYFSGVNNATLFKNKFIVPVGEENFNYFYGAEFLGCTDYTIERNYFTGVGSGKHAGLWIIYSGPYSNEIYLNDFDNLTIGTGVQKLNRHNVKKNVGLELLCGYYDHNDYDIALTGQDAEIAWYQGNYSNAAGNIFDTDFSIQNSHLSDEGSEGFIYFHHQEDLFNVEPDSFSASIILDNLGTPFISRANSCPTLAQQSESEFKIIVEDKREVINDLESEFQQLVDNGNTQSLLNIATSSVYNSSDIRIALLEASPYLSEELLLAVVNRIEPLNQWHLCEILLANSPLPNNVWQVYENQAPLSEYLDNLLIQYQDGSSSYENQLSQINVERRLKEIALKGYVKEIYKDTVEVKINNLKDIMVNEELNREIKTKVNLAHIQSNTAEALLLLNNYEESTNDRWKDVMEIYLSLDIGNMFADITEAQLAELNDIKDSENPGFIEAGNLLEIITGIPLAVELIYPNEDKSLSGKPNIKQPKKRKPELAGVYPNPAQGDFYITYVLPTERNQASIDIYNLEGKLIRSEDITSGYGILQLNARNYEAGLYVFNLQLEGQTVATHKFTVVD